MGVGPALAADDANRSDGDRGDRQPLAQREPFARLRALQASLADELGIELDTLSMGMSDDMEAAIAEGATWVRVGTAIFGARAPAAASGDA